MQREAWLCPIVLGDGGCCVSGARLLPRYPQGVTRSQCAAACKLETGPDETRVSLLPPGAPPVASVTTHENIYFYSIKQLLRCVVGYVVDPADCPPEIQLLALIST